LAWGYRCDRRFLHAVIVEVEWIENMEKGFEGKKQLITGRSLIF